MAGRGLFRWWSGDVVHEGVETVDQAQVAFGFGVPAARLGIVGEGAGVVTLGLEDGQMSVSGVEAGAVLANVGVAAGSLGRRVGSSRQPGRS